MNNKKCKQWIISLSLGVLFFVLLVGLLNYIIDPLQFYRKSILPPVFSSNERFQNPGLAKNYDYSAIIIGTSMTENFIPSYFNKKFGLKTVKLSIEGGNPYEQNHTAELALNSKQVKKCFWGIDLFSFKLEPGMSKRKEFPIYLYDRNPLNDIKYLFISDTLNKSLDVIINYLFSKEKNYNIPEKLNYWGDSFTYDSSNVKIQNEHDFFEEHNPDSYDLEKSKQIINSEFIDLIKTHPNTEFYLFYPPYSIKYYKILYKINPKLINNWLETKKYFFEQTKNLKNVKIFDFQDDYSIAYNFSNYRDLTHYSPAINSMMVDMMKKDEFLVNDKNLATRMDSFFKLVKTIN